MDKQSENVIPAMVHPLGRCWDQPEHSDIEVDDTHALISQRTFNHLMEYSTSQPSGVYEGKMWKGRRGGDWFLYWFGESDLPGCCSNNRRLILIA